MSLGSVCLCATIETLSSNPVNHTLCTIWPLNWHRICRGPLLCLGPPGSSEELKSRALRPLKFCLFCGKQADWVNSVWYVAILMVKAQNIISVYKYMYCHRRIISSGLKCNHLCCYLLVILLLNQPSFQSCPLICDEPCAVLCIFFVSQQRSLW